MKRPYIVIDAPGYYNKLGQVYSTHATLDAARRAARRHTYTDERGNRRCYATVAVDDAGYYCKGGKFWADMAPTPWEVQHGR